MARRSRNTGLAEDLLSIAAKLPWWLSLLVALVIYGVLHNYAGRDIPTATSTREIGTIAAHGFARTLATIGQYVLPLIFVAGALASALSQKKRERLVSRVADSPSPTSLGQMSWQSFEGLVQEAFRLQGYAVRRIGGDGPDGGVDLELRRGSETVLVQCKQWRAFKVGVAVVRELYGVMAAQGAAMGIVVTSGSFTQDAIEFASGRNVRLIAGPELFEMIREVRFAEPHTIEGSLGQAATGTSDARSCPVCGDSMVRREAKRGANAGQAFYGCRRFPACRGTIAIK